MNESPANLRPPAQAAPALSRLTPAELADLIASFNDVTAKLQRTHETLRAQVASLQQELRSANEQLRRSRALAALGEMAAGIAHEIRNPLGSIQLYAQALEEDLRESPQQRDLARRIAEAVHGLDRVVRDVLVFARPLASQRRPLDIAALFEQTLACGAALLEHSGVRVQRRIAEDLPRAEGDPDLLRQALLNLLRNAVEALAQSPPEGEEEARVWLLARPATMRDDRGVRAPALELCVEDNGPGLREDAKEKLFQPFFTTKREGAGMGLAVVHRIVDVHHGAVRVERRAPRGARFVLALPVLAAPREGDGRLAPAQGCVVDDSSTPAVSISREEGAAS
ncbi:MAG: hypothetical protein D6824_00070 [Planctomycetota bacterium]|nr:MAG: hypothetical protein D6824_00070 [Planctomycetota bacterium]